MVCRQTFPYRIGEELHVTRQESEIGQSGF
jgi:hypothetical protein